MASRAKRGFTSRGGKNYLWTVVIFSEVMGTASTAKVPLVADSDWVGAAGQPSATVVAIRGYIATHAISSSTASVGRWYIGKLDKDIAVPESPALADTYVNEDIMYTGGVAKALGSVESRQLSHEIIDIGAKRRIKGGTEIIMAHRASVTNEITISGLLRTLLLLNA